MRTKVILVAAVIAAVVGAFGLGHRVGSDAALHLPTYTADGLAGQGVATLMVGDMAYGIAETVPWTDRDGVEHGDGWPECLPSGEVKNVRFAGAVLWHEGFGVATVVWVDCRGR